ncbi:hypothetical protein M422DRAFT_269105 [Sphaerobolus stellatus SS14]|uniref:Uncharacterized protein n=1 Tax=Sphaerobolus stellatus (strain SS14) TaxID=990650 RepID=A0A0C9UVW7_SPHS4|nr:hypothetical protein M422DRAFT_269105 [Sphaerobolus stellatus SS14]
MSTEHLHSPIPPLIDPILHEEPRLRFETFEYHPSYPENETFPVPDRTEAVISMKELWQPIVDRYWNTVRAWIVVKNLEWEKAIARKEGREAKEREAKEAEKVERERVQRRKDREKDERVAKELGFRKRK